MSIAPGTRDVLGYSCGKCHAIRMQSGVIFASPGFQTSPL